MHQAHFVEIRIAHRGHAVTLRGAGDVQFQVHTKPFAGMGNLHHAGDAAVIFRVGAREVGSLRGRHVNMRFDKVKVLALQ